MFRFFIFLFIHISGILSFNLFNEGITPRMSTIDEIEAGKEFTVEITLDKGDLSSFSRYQANIPAGLIAKPIQSANGEFKFEDKKVKIVWLRLPSEEQITFKYAVKVDQRLKGNFDLSGSFSYIENNERKSVNVPSKSIKINPSAEIDPRLIVDIKDFEKSIIPNLTPSQDVACIRQTPKISKNSDEIIINLLVNKANREKFAKIEEIIPNGYIAENVNSQSGIFIFKNQTVKFLWMNLPPEDYFVVSYKLIPKPEIKNRQPAIKGVFSYIEGEATRNINIVQKDADLTNLTKEKVQDILFASVTTSTQPIYASIEKDLPETVIEKPIKKEEPTPIKEDIKIPVIPETELETISEDKIIEEIIKKEETKQIVTPKDKTVVKPIIKTDKNYILQPETGVYYRVQLAAGHRPVNINRYFKKYNLKEEVKREQHEGWYKYSVGSFKEYIEARNYRVDIWDNTEIKDAFVAAYNNGYRITVQEALMISNQKWYK
jgi:hypothetical protein